MNSGKPVCNFCCNTIADREVKDISEPKHQCKNPYAFRLNESLLTKYSYSHSEIMNEKKKLIIMKEVVQKFLYSKILVIAI